LRIDFFDSATVVAAPCGPNCPRVAPANLIWVDCIAPASVNAGHEITGRLDLGLDSLYRDFSINPNSQVPMWPSPVGTSFWLAVTHTACVRCWAAS
jgi:hypothetical protein